MKNNTYFLLALIAGVLLMSACNEPTLIGADVYPNDLNIKIDTFEVETYTVREKALVTTTNQRHACGYMEDPVFGKTVAGIYTQVGLGSSLVDFGSLDSLTLDSMVLNLVYNDEFYGDEADAHTYVVYELANDMLPDSAYRSNQDLPLYPISIGQTGSVPLDFATNFYDYGDTVPPSVRIRLDDFFGQRILDQSGNDNLSNNESFINYMKGIYVTVSDTNSMDGKSMPFFELGSTYSRISLYYSVGSTDSLRYDFPINLSDIAFSRFSHDYTGSEADPFIITNGVANDPVNYAQSLTGLKTQVLFPDILQLQNVAINSAKLIITQEEDITGLDTSYTAPNIIGVFKANEDGTNSILEDAFIEISSVINSSLNPFAGSGYYEEESSSFIGAFGDTTKQWKINMGFHVQEAIDGNIDNNGVFIAAIPSGQSANRIKICGGNHPDASKRMKLVVQYTEIN